MFDYRSMFDLHGKTALVVGAASGIGQASALGVAAFGANTFCADVNLAGAEETARMAREQGGQAQAILLDMRDPKGMADALKDIAPVTRLARGPLVVAVNASLPIRSMNELIAYAKARPGAVSFSATGPFNLSFLAGELLNHLTGIKMVAVPYKGASPGSAAIASGEVQVGFMDTTGVLPFVQSGRVRLLATAESKRTLTMPELPTVAESGVPGYDASSWLALVAAGGTPAEILARLSAEVARAFTVASAADAAGRAPQAVELVNFRPEDRRFARAPDGLGSRRRRQSRRPRSCQ